MGFFSRLVRGLESPQVSLQDAEAFLDLYDGGKKSASGVRINRKTVLRHSAVYRGVNLIATTVGKLRLHVLDDKKEPDKSHPAYRLLRRKPNREMTALVFKRTLTAHALLQGGGFAYIVRRGDGRPVELLPLMPDRTWPFREGGVLKYMTTLGGTLEDGGEPRKLDADEVLHIKGLGWNGLTGYTIYELGADELGLAIGGVKYGAKYFSNAVNPSVVIEFPHRLSDKAFKRLRDTWEKVRPGLERSHLPAVVDEGGKMSAFAVDPGKAQLIESRKFDLVAIANLLGLPVHKVGGEGRTAYGSLEQENQSFLDEGLDGWLCNWEEESEDKLLTEEEKEAESRSIEFNRKQLVQANLTMRMGAYRTAVGGQPFMTVNEVRRRESLPPVPGGDELAKPKNMGQGGPDNDPKDESGGVATDEAKEPAAAGDESQRKLRAAHRQVLQDAVRRMCRRLGVQAVKRRADLLRWQAEFEDEHRDVVDEALAPAQALLDSRGGDEQPCLLGEFFSQYRAELQGVTAEHVQRTTDRIEAELPAAFAATFFPE